MTESLIMIPIKTGEAHMQGVFAIPYSYINGIGLSESLVLSYIIEELANRDDYVSRIMINKSVMQDDFRLKFLSSKEIGEGIDGLYNCGFIFFHKKGDRRTKTISLSIVNMILFELMGAEQYRLSLIDCTSTKMSGKIIPFDIVENVDMKIPDYISMTSRNIYVDYLDGIEEVRKEIMFLYSFDFKKMSSYVKDGVYTPPVESKIKPINIESFMYNGKCSPLSNKKNRYKFIMNGGEIDPFTCEEKSNSISDSGTFEEELSLRELARNNYEKFCEFMKIKITMSKPIMSWNARDFVSYMYCGMAKLNEGSGNFIFPDFASDGYRMKKLMDKYGNKRLNRVIYLMVKDTDNMIKHCGFKDFRATPSILSVGWMFDKMLGYSEHLERVASERAIVESIDSSRNNEEENLNKDDSGAKLEELRKKFNDNKETK